MLMLNFLFWHPSFPPILVDGGIECMRAELGAYRMSRAVGLGRRRARILHLWGA